jgi:hypothetical protein
MLKKILTKTTLFVYIIMIGGDMSRNMGLVLLFFFVAIFILLFFALSFSSGKQAVLGCAQSKTKTSSPFQQIEQSSSPASTTNPDNPPRIPTPQGANKNEIEEGSEGPGAPATGPSDGC